MRGIGHEHDEIGSRLAGKASLDHVAGNRLVERRGSEAVGARQIEQTVTTSERSGEIPLLALDGDARVIGDLLPTASQPVEQGRLAAIRQTDQRHSPLALAHASVRDSNRRLDEHVVRFFTTEGEQGSADAHGDRIMARPHARHDLDPCIGHETDLEQASCDRRLVAHTLDPDALPDRNAAERQGRLVRARSH